MKQSLPPTGPRKPIRAVLSAGLALLALALVGTPPLHAEYYFTHLAGPLGGPGNADGPPAVGRFYHPVAFAFDPSGNLVVVDPANHTLRKVNPQGVISTIPVSFSDPRGIAIDTAGTIYVSDVSTHTIYKVGTDGTKTAWVGKSYQPSNVGITEIGLSDDGPADTARFFRPSAMIFDPAGNLYVADTDNHTIRRVTPAGVVTTFAGAPGQADTVDSTGAAARFSRPRSLALDAAGNLHVGETFAIRKVTPGGTVTTLAGRRGGGVVGTGSVTSLNGPMIALAPNGDLIATGNAHLYRVTPAGDVTLFAGAVDQQGRADGTLAQARFVGPRAVWVGPTGRILVADAHAIRQISPEGVVSTFAGATGGRGLGDGMGAGASFDQPVGIAVDQAGNAFIADANNLRVRKVAPDGTVTTVGPAGTAVQGPTAIALDATGNIVIAPAGPTAVLKMTPQGTLLNLVGQPVVSGSPVGAGDFGRGAIPYGAAIGPDGSIYVSDHLSRTIWKFSPAGERSQLVLKSTEKPFEGGNGLAFDQAGNLYVAGGYSHTIDKITPDGVLTVFAGKPFESGHADGTGQGARFFEPGGVAVDATGNLFVADTGNNTIRRITPAGAVTTVGGRAGTFGSGDGIGAEAHFFAPHGIAIDRSGTLYITEEWNHAIRQGRVAGAPTIQTQPQNRNVTTGTAVSFSVTASGVPEPTYQWHFNGSPYQGATSSTLSFTDARAADAGDYTVVVTNALGNVTSAKATLAVTAASVSPPSSTGGGAGGGGAPSVWFLIVLGALRLVRRVRRLRAGR